MQAKVLAAALSKTRSEHWLVLVQLPPLLPETSSQQPAQPHHKQKLPMRAEPQLGRWAETVLLPPFHKFWRYSSVPVLRTLGWGCPAQSSYRLPVTRRDLHSPGRWRAFTC